MSVPPEEIARKVRHWVVFAEEDLVMAQHGLTLGSDAPLRLVAYHAQQCVEKYLKAFLVWRRVDFPYTHNLARLLELIAEHVDWADGLSDAATLTPFAVTARYPGEDLEVDREEARQAIAIAEGVRGVVRQALLDEGVAL
jgi:HEPN domain-containing protein